MNQIPYRKGITWAFWEGDLYAVTDHECICVATDCEWGAFSDAFSFRIPLSDRDGIALAKVRGFEVGPEPVESAKPVTVESLQSEIAALRRRVAALECKVDAPDDNYLL